MDKDIAIATLKNHANAICVFPPSVKKDTSILLEAAKVHGVVKLFCADPRHLPTDDEGFMMEMITLSVRSFHWLDRTLQSNNEFMFAALQKIQPLSYTMEEAFVQIVVNAFTGEYKWNDEVLLAAIRLTSESLWDSQKYFRFEMEEQSLTWRSYSTLKWLKNDTIIEELLKRCPYLTSVKGFPSAYKDETGFQTALSEIERIPNWFEDDILMNKLMVLYRHKQRVGDTEKVLQIERMIEEPFKSGGVGRKRDRERFEQDFV